MNAPAPHSKVFRRIVIGLAIMVGVIALIMWRQSRQIGEQSVFQGYVESHLVYVAPENGGRITQLDLVEGDQAVTGMRAFTLDGQIETAQRQEAEAKLVQMKAQLKDLTEAQQRPEQIAVLKAQEDQARAQLDLARVELERQKTLFQRGYTAKAMLDQAQTTFDQTTAALAAAHRQITAAELAGRLAVIDAAEAAVKAAEASLAKADTVLNKRNVKVPQDGKVQEIFFRVGEVVNAGQPVLSLLPPGNFKFRFYVPEPIFSKFQIGQQVDITCDSCPTGLTARISFIARNVEFTPPVIFSDEERAKLVFKVEAKPITPIDLPVGLPIKVHIRNERVGDPRS